MQLTESQFPVLVIPFCKGEIHCCRSDGHHGQTMAAMYRLSMKGKAKHA